MNFTRTRKVPKKKLHDALNDVSSIILKDIEPIVITDPTQLQSHKDEIEGKLLPKETSVAAVQYTYDNEGEANEILKVIYGLKDLLKIEGQRASKVSIWYLIAKQACQNLLFSTCLLIRYAK